MGRSNCAQRQRGTGFLRQFSDELRGVRRRAEPAGCENASADHEPELHWLRSGPGAGRESVYRRPVVSGGTGGSFRLRGRRGWRPRGLRRLRHRQLRGGGHCCQWSGFHSIQRGNGRDGLFGHGRKREQRLLDYVQQRDRGVSSVLYP